MKREVIICLAISFLLAGVMAPFGQGDSWLTCLVLAGMYLVAAEAFKGVRNALYFLSAISIFVLPHVTFIPVINAILGSAILIVVGAIILLTQIRLSRLKSL